MTVSQFKTRQIGDKQITLAKIQDISAQYKLLGRVSSGAGVTEEISTSANMVTLLGSADNAAARDNLGVEIGVDVQAYDAELAALAGLTSAANKVPYFTGSGTAALLDLSTSASLGSSDTTVSSQNAVKSYVDAALLNVDLKDPVHAAIDTEVDLSSELVNGASLGGVTVVTGNRYLLTGQVIDASENGIYVAVASGAASRSTDANTSAKVTYGMKTFVIAGTFAGQTATLVTTGAITLDTTDLDFSISDFGSYTAGDAIDITGGVISVENAGVTYAKIQNISAQYKLLGRASSGAGVTEEISTSAFGLSLIDDADAAAAQTTLGLVIGTNVQAYDAELAAIAGLTSAANKIPYFTGSGTAAMFDFKDEDNMVSDSATAIPSQQSVKAYVDTAISGVAAPTLVVGEVPTGLINGSNDTFELANVPTAGSVAVYLNGQRLLVGAGNDYTISSDTITMLTIPASGEVIFVDYNY